MQTHQAMTFCIKTNIQTITKHNLILCGFSSMICKDSEVGVAESRFRLNTTCTAVATDSGNQNAVAYHTQRYCSNLRAFKKYLLN